MKTTDQSEQIDIIVEKYGGWKGENITKLRKIMHNADSSIAEEVKWRMKTRPEGLPVWSHNGILCILETFKDNQKLVFFKGAQMKQYAKFFNARLNSSTDRAIEYHEGDTINEKMVKVLMTEALKLNTQKSNGPKSSVKR